MTRARALQQPWKTSEHQHQAALIAWFDAAYPLLRGRLFAIPNGGQRNKITAAKLKAEGVRSGVPDLCLPVPRRTSSGVLLAGLFIELKAGKNKPTETQLDWLGWLGQQGYAAYCCTGWDAAKQVIEEYLRDDA